MTESIYSKFAAAWERVENPPLDSVNPHFKSKFASLGAVYRAIRKACKGIAYMQAFGTEDNGGETVLTINSWAQDAEGGRIELSSLRMPITDNPQQQGSIITYYRRYVAVTDWGIVGEEDDDGNAASPKPKADPDYQRQRGAKKAAKKAVTIEDTKLFKECEASGIRAEGMWNWYNAQGFGTTDLNALTAAEKKKVEAYLKGMLDSANEVF